MTTIKNYSALGAAPNPTGAVGLKWLLIVVAIAFLLAAAASRAFPRPAREAGKGRARILAPLDPHGAVPQGKQLAPRIIFPRQGVKPGKSMSPLARAAP